MIKEKLYVKDNIQLTDEEFSNSLRYIEVLSKVIDARDRYIDQNKLRRDILLPSGLEWGNVGQWGGSWQALRQQDRDNINVLKTFGNVFSDRPISQYDDEAQTPEPDPSVHRTIAMMEALPEKWRHLLPNRFGEIGWNYAGHPINCQTETHQERFAILFVAGVLDWLSKRAAEPRPVRILEIGPGCGEALYTFGKAFDEGALYACDLPESQAHATTFLTTLLPTRTHLIFVGNLDADFSGYEDIITRDAASASTANGSVIYIPNFLIEELAGNLEIDLTYNAWSFSEMDEAQLRFYCEIVSTMIGKSGIIFEQNGDLRSRGGTYTSSVMGDYFANKKDDLLKADAEARALGGETNLWANHRFDQLSDYVGSKESILHALREISADTAPSPDNDGDSGPS